MSLYNCFSFAAGDDMGMEMPEVETTMEDGTGIDKEDPEVRNKKISKGTITKPPSLSQNDLQLNFLLSLST